MDITPQSIRALDFSTVKKGYDPDEVDAFRDDVAEALERALAQAAQMEARARSAVARLQEASHAGSPAEQTPPGAPAPVGDAEVISRTLLLAQRTADTTVAEARAEAQRITTLARDEASNVLEHARSAAAEVVEEARADARRAKEAELERAENELQALLARREFLLADVEQLEGFVLAQRERLREAAADLQQIVERVPGGLGEMRRPVLSASAEPVVSSRRTDPVPVAPAPPSMPHGAPTATPPAVATSSSVPAVTTTVHDTVHDTVPRAAVSAAPDHDDDIDDDDPLSLFEPRVGAAADDDEVTAEVPVTQPRQGRQFTIGGDELR